MSKFAVMAAFAVALSSFALAQPVFNVIVVPNSSPNTPTGINDSSLVLINTPSGPTSTISEWSRLNGTQVLSLPGTYNVGNAMDLNGDVAGAGVPAGGSYLQAFLWQPATGAQWLGTLGGPMSAANAVNASGGVAGTSFTASIFQHAFLWTPALGMQDLTPTVQSVGGATATAVNTSGLVAGYYYPNEGGNPLGFAWTQANGLVTFGQPGTLPLAVNDAAIVVGQELTAKSEHHAFYWTSVGGIVDLGTLGGDQSTALSINNNGWIVGTSLTGDQTGILHGFLWTPAGGMVDVTALANQRTQLQPYSMQVNDYGVIALSSRKQVLLFSPKMEATGTSSANPSVVGQPVTFTINVTSIAGPPPDGETLTYDLNNHMGSATIVGGVAQFTITGLKAGTHNLTVTYTGDANYLTARNVVLTQVVNPSKSPIAKVANPHVLRAAIGD